MEHNRYDINQTRIDLFVTSTLNDIKKAVEQIIFTYEDQLPDKNAKILLKPNLNNDLNALTGCTTDLRIIVAVIESLQKRGYTKICVGDGPNCGAFHEKIDVHSRLGVTAIGKKYGVDVVDFNFDETVIKKLGKRETKISKTFAEADLDRKSVV